MSGVQPLNCGTHEMVVSESEAWRALVITHDEAFRIILERRDAVIEHLDHALRIAALALVEYLVSAALSCLLVERHLGLLRVVRAARRHYCVHKNLL